MLARYSVNSGGFKGNLASLRSAGLINRGNPVVITDAGILAAVAVTVGGMDCAVAMTAGGTSGMNLRTQPTIANALPALSNGTADQLNLEAEESATLPISQQREVLASGFIKTTLPATLTATK